MPQIRILSGIVHCITCYQAEYDMFPLESIAHDVDAKIGEPSPDLVWYRYRLHETAVDLRQGPSTRSLGPYSRV
jgi:hypothetical protein